MYRAKIYILKNIFFGGICNGAVYVPTKSILHPKTKAKNCHLSTKINELFINKCALGDYHTKYTISFVVAYS